MTGGMGLRVKRAEDEPKCEALRQENTALMEQVLAYRDRQMGFLQDVESLKQEKAELIAENVRPPSFARFSLLRARRRVVRRAPAERAHGRPPRGVGLVGGDEHVGGGDREAMTREEFGLDFAVRGRHVGVVG